MSKSRRRRPHRRADPAQPPPPRRRRIVGLDLGSRRIGVAVTDAEGGFVAQRHVIHRRDLDRDRSEIASILDAYGGATILVGLPLSMDGSEGPQAKRTRLWADGLLGGRLETVVFRDERLTTVAAKEQMPTEAVDAAAADVLVRDYLNDRTAE